MSRQAIIALCLFVALWCVVSPPYMIDIRGAIFVSSDVYRTTGEILSSEVIYYYDAGKRCGEPRERYYRYSILYKYAIADKDYTSHQIDSTSQLASLNPAFAERYVRKYPVSRTVTVYY